MTIENQLIEEKIEYILENFNFERVALVMQTLDWKWAQHDGTHKVPNIQQIKVRARHLLESSYESIQKNEDAHSIGTQSGGLQATCYESFEEGEQCNFLLQFIVTQFDTDDYED